jgi:hypothetical protein
MTRLPPWLPPAVSYIPQWLDYQMRVTEQPGCAVAVAYRGQIVSPVLQSVELRSEPYCGGSRVSS